MADLNSFLADEPTAGTPAASPPPSAQAAASSVDLKSFLNDDVTIDELTGEEVHEAFSGRTPDTAINKSPLTALDRFKMSMGNQAGNMEYLKKRFDAVQPILDAEGKPTSELAVQQYGKWHRVDAKNNWETKDPWQLAKEYIGRVAQYGPVGGTLIQMSGNEEEFLGDVMDQAPVIGGVAAGLATGGIATGAMAATGVAAGTAAATSTARTSLGRVVGTYDATPEEQLWDIGLETLLNTAGVAIPLAVKPTAKWISNTALGKLVDQFGDVVGEKAASAGEAVLNSPKALYKKMFAGLSVGETNFDTAVEKHREFRAMTDWAWNKVGGNKDALHDELRLRQLQDVSEEASGARKLLTNLYKKQRDKIINEVPKNFSANLDDAINASYSDAFEKQIGKLVIKNGDSVGTLTGVDAINYVNANGMKNATFELMKPTELKRLLDNGAELGDIGKLMEDENAYKIVQQYYDRLGKFRGIGQRSGPDGAKLLLDFKKVAGDLSWGLTQTEEAAKVKGVRDLLNKANTNIDNVIFEGFKKGGKEDAFMEMNAMYSEAKREAAPFINAHDRYVKGADIETSFKPLLNNLLSKPGKQVSGRTGFNRLVELAEDNGLYGEAKLMKNRQTSIQVAEAVRAFNPIQPAGDKIKAGITGMGTYALLTGNNKLLASIAASQAARSPMTAKVGVEMSHAMFKGQQFLANLPPKQRMSFINNPQAVSTFMQAIVQAPITRSQVTEQLSSVMAQQPPGQGTGQ